MKATAAAHPNIALVKYWGKRDERLVLPHHGSLSLTLSGMEVRTTVAFDPRLEEDQVLVGGAAASPGDTERVLAILDAVRALAGETFAARVESGGDFPVAAGLAASAAAYAALAGAASWAAGLDLSRAHLSGLARLGSGSAARSVHGGFAVWERGARADGADSLARQLLPPDAWDVRMVVAVVDAGPKAISSREAMRRTVETSPFYPAWVRSAEDDLVRAEAAVLARDLQALGEIADLSSMRMHATAMAARPPIAFFAPSTLEILAAVRELRGQGTGAWATVDAGPNVAVLCAGADAPRVESVLSGVPGVRWARIHAPGEGVRRI